MKYLIKFSMFETRSTSQDILDFFTDDRLRSFDIDDQFKLSILRVKGSFKVIIIDKKYDKVIGRVYITSITPNGKGGYKAELRRLHVNDDYRGKGFGELLLTTAMKAFGDIDLYGYPGPNRIVGLNDENREEFRQRLIKFYDRLGLKRVSDKSFRLEKPSDNLKIN